jgi:hypothetical protein
MSARSLLRECFWPRDARSAREIEAGVREELEAHVDRLVDEQIRAGTPAEEGRRRAVEQFGDVDRYAAECRRIDLGERLVVRRALAVACIALAATSAYFGWRAWQSEQLARQLRQDLARFATGASSTATSKAEWVERLATLRDHMHTAFGVGPELTLLAPDEGLAIVREAWPRIAVAEVKTGLLKAFAFSKALAPNKHPRLLEVLDLGMTDPDLEIRAYAATYLEEYAGEDFSGQPEQYAAWSRRHAGMTPEEVTRLMQNPLK